MTTSTQARAEPGSAAAANTFEPLTGRRLELVEAAVRVVSAGGLRALTHRAVDAEAGVSQGSTSGYYRTRVALLTALAQHVGRLLFVQISDLRERLLALGYAVEDPALHDAVTEEVVILIRRLLSQHNIVLVQAELSLEAVRTPSLRETIDQWRMSLQELVAAIVAVTSGSDPQVRSKVLVASLQGVLLAALQEPKSRQADYAESAVRHLLAGLSD